MYLPENSLLFCLTTVYFLPTTYCIVLLPLSSVFSTFLVPTTHFYHIIPHLSILAPHHCRLTSFSPPTFTGKFKGISRGLIRHSEGRGPTNPLPTPYQPPINPLSTMSVTRTKTKRKIYRVGSLKVLQITGNFNDLIF